MTKIVIMLVAELIVFAGIGIAITICMRSQIPGDKVYHIKKYVPITAINEHEENDNHAVKE